MLGGTSVAKVANSNFHDDPNYCICLVTIINEINNRLVLKIVGVLGVPGI